MAQIEFGAAAPGVETEGPRRLEIPPARYTSAEFLDLERVKPNTLGNTRMLRVLQP